MNAIPDVRDALALVPQCLGGRRDWHARFLHGTPAVPRSVWDCGLEDSRRLDDRVGRTDLLLDPRVGPGDALIERDGRLPAENFAEASVVGVAAAHALR